MFWVRGVQLEIMGAFLAVDAHETTAGVHTTSVSAQMTEVQQDGDGLCHSFKPLIAYVSRPAPVPENTTHHGAQINLQVTQLFLAADMQNP